MNTRVWLLATGILAIVVFASHTMADEDTEVPAATPPVDTPADESPGADLQLDSELQEQANEKFPGQRHLDEATKLKITARNFQDLAKVITLCERAVREGVDDQNKAFAQQMITSTRLERATRVGSEIFDRKPPNQNWPRLAQMALMDLEAVVSQEEQLADAHLLIGRIHSLPGGKRDRARAALEKAIDHAGDDLVLKAKALTLRSELNDDAEKKLADLNEALKLVPDHVPALRARGLYFMSQDEHKKALADFQEALRLEPEHAKTHEVLAVDLLLAGQVDEAKAELDKAIELAPDEASAYAHRARIYAVKGENENALKDVNRALEINADNLAWRLLRAQVQQQAGDTEAALDDIDKVLAVDPGLMPAIRLRAALLAGSDRVDEAIEGLNQAIEADPENAELVMALAALHTMQRKPTQAIEIFDKFLETEEPSVEILRSRADALLSIGRQAEAVADYERALKLEPRDSGVLNNLAWVLATSPDDKVRDGERAVKLAKTACEVTQYKLPHIISTLAASYAESGDFETAVKWSQKAHDMGEGEMKEHLAKELASFQAGEPWREIQNVEEEDAMKDGEDDAGGESEEDTDDKPDADASSS